MKKIFLSILFLCGLSLITAQQIAIPRIDNMPNLPTPYLMRDWKQVAINYDNLVFDTNLIGTYLPITKISTANGVNYPEIKTIRMDTYVGQTNHGSAAEAINIIPAIVGASLVGVDKTTHFSTNWVAKIKDFYNLKNNQKVYLNSYSTGTGNDWWYEIMPNVFFYQLYALYPSIDADFSTQFTAIADRELEVLHKLGGTIQPWNVPNMNYRAFNLISGLPNTTSVPEPETAGSIAWLLYQAYTQTKNPSYLQGAELSLDFLQNWTSNPSYEIQLPYGIAAAARMNAVEGTNYDIQKMMNWTFSSGKNTLRGWGCIVGNWNGYDVSGLIGEANDGGDDYAFSMNGFQHAAALVPVAKYDKRYARAIGKWMLNLANSSRLFYSNALPQANQEAASYAWAKQYDSNSCIPFESMKQTWNGTKPMAMGDAVGGGWAATNLSLYSGSSVGYLAAVIDKTNVEGILRIDLNKTDFRGENAYPTYLYYNPTTTLQTVEITLPTGNYDVYDAITETVLKTNVSGITSCDVTTDGVRQLVIYPTGKTSVTKGRIKTIDGKVIDYHANNNYTNMIRIKAFSVSDTLVQISNSINVFCLPENNTANTSFQWFQNNVLVATTTSGTYSWKAPATAGVYQLKCKVSENADTVSSAAISIKVVDKLIVAPVIADIIFSTTMPFDLNAVQTPTATINTIEVQYEWSCAGGTLTNQLTASPTWNLPGAPGIYSISLTATNTAGTNSFTKSVLVKDLGLTEEPTPLIYYPFNGDTKNAAQDAFHAVSVSAVAVNGANGITNAAYQFPSSASYIYTPNQTALNFQDKISITPDKKVRWTVKTTSAVVDVDADTLIEAGKFVHFTAIYSGYSLELYRNGKLSAFKALTGNVRTTAKSITIARKDEGTSDYNFRGTVDELRIYDAELPLSIIKLLPTTFKLKAGIEDTIITTFKVFPNPFSNDITISLPSNETIQSVQLYDLLGKRLFESALSTTTFSTKIPNGFYILRITAISGNVYKAKVVKKE